MSSDTLRVDGVVVFWSLSEHTSLPALRSGLESLGLGAYVPHPRTVTNALRAALEEVYNTQTTLVRPTKGRDGFVVVEELREPNKNAYTPLFTVKPGEEDAGGEVPLVFSPAYSAYLMSPELSGKITEAFEHQRQLLPSANVTRSLTGILLNDLGATTLRPRGGLYWLPETSSQRWAAVAQLVEGAALAGKQNSIYALRHRMDADAVRAVRDAICNETLTAVGRLKEEVFSGELGPRAMKTRGEELVDIRRKVKAYEALLGQGLEDLTAGLEAAETSLAAASLLSDESAETPQEAAVA